MFQDVLFVPERDVRTRAAVLPASAAIHAFFVLLFLTLPLFRAPDLPRVVSTGVFLAPPPPVPRPAPPKGRGGNTAAKTRIKRVASTVLPADGRLLAPVDIPDGLVDEGFGPIGIEGGIEGGVDYGSDEDFLSRFIDDSLFRVIGRETEPVRAGGEIRPPRLVRRVAPAYPEIARQARVQGNVILEATTDVSGRVLNVRVLKSVPLLDDAAVEAVRQWLYEPLMVNGRPRAVTFTVTVRFELK